MPLRVAAALACVATTVLAAQGRPLPDEQTFYAAARDNLARAAREQDRYAYKERRTELHMNPFGRIGTDGETRVYEVTPEGPAVLLRRLVEKDGQAVADNKIERVERRQRQQGRSSIDDTVATLRFAIQRRETVAGRDAIVVRFEPRPDAKPQTREGRLARAFSGLIWVDEAAREVMKVEATAIDDISYGLGVVARLRKGTSVVLTRAPVDGDLWLPTSIRFTGEGRALLVRKLTVNYVVEWFEYKRIRG